MVVSEITNKELADYLKLEFADLTDSEKTDLNTLLSVAKAYIKSYTGLSDVSVTGEIVGTGDGVTTIFYVDNPYVFPDSQTIYIDGVAKIKTTDYAFEDVTGKITSVIPPVAESVISASYKSSRIDAYEDFVIVVYILVQDMYDNRTLYVEKGNINKIVDTILGMYCVNLL